MIEDLILETVDYDGVKLATRIGTNDCDTVHEIFVDRYYTEGDWDIPIGGTVLDIGGSIGAFAAFAVSQGAAYVHTYEPTDESFDLLLQNINPYPNISAYRVAIAPEAGIVFMSGYETLDDGTVNTGSPMIVSDGIEEVIAVSIHDVLMKEPFWDVMKIDIEGFEYELLESLSRYEFDRIGMIVMEFHHDVEEETFDRGLALAASLGAEGFDDVEVIWSWGLQGRLRARR